MKTKGENETKIITGQCQDKSRWENSSTRQRQFSLRDEVEDFRSRAEAELNNFPLQDRNSTRQTFQIVKSTFLGPGPIVPVCISVSRVVIHSSTSPLSASILHALLILDS